MKLKFDRHAVQKFVALLPHAADKIVLVKDDGIYLMSRAEVVADGVKHAVAYARGYNPTTDGDIWDKCRAAVGGDDFAEAVGTRDQFADILAKSEGDILVTVTASNLAVSYIQKRTDAQKAARAAAVKGWFASANAHPRATWSPRMKRLGARLEKELAGLESNAVAGVA